jgi:hypothetical protein
MKPVSNRHMPGTSLSLLILLVTSCVPAQGPPADEREAAIRRVKTLLVSSLDHGLPKVTLEFFLNYEGEGGAVKWQVTDCGETPDLVGDHKQDPAICVRADVGLKDGRAATVLISTGTLKKGEANVPSVHAVSVTYPGGTVNRLDRLGDLPVELHRELPKGPKDLPSDVSA